MNYKNMLAMAAALTMASMMSGCAGKESTEPNEPDEQEIVQTTAAVEETTAPEEEPLPEPPMPVEASDPNTVTFDDEDFSFAEIQDGDKDSAHGTLSVVAVQGNNMLKFTDSGSNFADGTVQKIKIDAARLLSAENLAKVRSIEMDVYADATAEEFVNEDDENVRAPGWIGGGGGANVSGDKWYDFAEWQGGEYNFEMSGAVHVQMKFLLAAGGKCWDGEMDESIFQVMRWGAQNEGNFYIDNIVFYDGDGNSLPIEKSQPVEEDAPEETDAEPEI